MRKKAISYIRMSTDQQLKGHSLQRQINQTKEYCDANGLELIEELTDIGLSGFSGQHREKGQLRLFFDGMRDGTLDPNVILIVESLDRLSRQNPLTAMSQFNELLSYGVEIRTLFDNQIYTKETIGQNAGLLFLSMGQMIRSYEESNTKSKRLQSVWAKKKGDRNSIVTSQCPKWLNVIKDEKGKPIRFELDKVQSNIIKTIFALSMDKNLGSYAITNYLNKNIDKFPKQNSNSRNKDNGWAESYVKSILINPSVYGLYQPHKKVDGKRVKDGEPIEDYYPKILTKEEFLLNRSIMKERTIRGRGRHSEGFPNVFRGLLKCKHCGTAITYKTAERKKGGPILRCQMSLQSRNGCEALSVQYPIFEQLFFNVTKDKQFQQILNQTDDVEQKKRELDLQLVQLEVQKTNLSNQINQMMDEYTDGDLPLSLKGRLKDRMVSVDEQLSTVEDQIGQLKLELNAVGFSGEGEVSDLLETISKGDLTAEDRMKLNSILKKFIEYIEIDNSPSFSREEVLDGSVGVEDFNEDFMEWFQTQRTDRWLIKDPLKYVGSKVGFKMHQNFETLYFVHFNNGEERFILANGDFVTVDKEGGLVG